MAKAKFEIKIEPTPKEPMAHPNVKIIDLLVLCANVSCVTEEDINQNETENLFW